MQSQHRVRQRTDVQTCPHYNTLADLGIPGTRHPDTSTATPPTLPVNRLERVVRAD